MSALAVKEFMVGQPYTVQYDETAAKAERLMNNHRIRHLPVVDGKKIMGVLSDREIILGRAVYKHRDFDTEVFVKDICRFDDCSIQGSETIDRVAALMYKKKLDAVVIVENENPIGIFTSTDACRLLSELWRDRAPRKNILQRILGLFN